MAPAPDKINPCLLQKLLSKIANPLYVILKQLLTHGAPLSDWKTTNVTPIFKQMDDLPWDYFFQLRSEDQNRLRGYIFHTQ